MILSVHESKLYCNEVSVQERSIPEISFGKSCADGAYITGPLFSEPITIKCNLDLTAWDNKRIASLPVLERYMMHCFVKGWTPSVRGLHGFIRFLNLGYYKTLYI